MSVCQLHGEHWQNCSSLFVATAPNMATLPLMRRLVFCVCVAALYSPQCACAQTSQEDVGWAQEDAQQIWSNSTEDTQDDNETLEILGPFDFNHSTVVKEKEIEVLTDIAGDAGTNDVSYDAADPGSLANGRQTDKGETRNDHSSDDPTTNKQRPLFREYHREKRELGKSDTDVWPTESNSQIAALKVQAKTDAPEFDQFFSLVQDITKQQIVYTFVVWAALVIIVLLLIVGYLKSQGWLIEKEYVVNYV